MAHLAASNTIEADRTMTTTTLRTQLNAERSEATRARLLRHARAVFEKRGYGAASVADIVNASGLARGTFYVHFKSKREIFIAVVHSVRADLLEGQMRPMEGTGTVRDTVRFAIEQYLKAFKASARMINLIEEISISDRVVRAAWMETRDALQANTVHALTRLRERGLADFEGDPRIMSMVVGGMVERMGSIRYVLGYPFDDEEYFSTITSGYLDGARIHGDVPIEEARKPGVVKRAGTRRVAGARKRS
jgi:AcrR family transcriptional regulator